MVMIAGWRQWADAGSVSSGLPEYLIELTGARKIGEIKANSFYLFQIPGAHHLLRPYIRLEEGYRQELETKRNEFYYVGDEEQGLIIFLGDEPHLNVDQYAAAFFAAVQRLNVSRVVGVGGVFAPVPYEPDRQISCIYSLPRMKEALAPYAVTFSNYEGGSSIGSYLVSDAEARGVEYITFYAIVPAYDFNQTAVLPHGVRIENDYKAWYDLVRRFNHLFDLGLDTADLQRKSDQLLSRMDEQLDELEDKLPQLGVREYMEQLNAEFTELPFMPLGDVWEEELDDLFRDFDN